MGRSNVLWHAERGQVCSCVRTWAARPGAGGFSPQNHPENQLQRNKCKNKDRKEEEQVKKLLCRTETLDQFSRMLIIMRKTLGTISNLKTAPHNQIF